MFRDFLENFVRKERRMVCVCHRHGLYVVLVLFVILVQLSSSSCGDGLETKAHYFLLLRDYVIALRA